MPPTLHRNVVAGVPTIVIEDHALPVVSYVIALRHGAGYEPAGQSGATRTMLELLLRGTARRTRREMSDALEELGSSVSTAASHEIAYLRGGCLSRHLQRSLELVGEALTEPGFREDERERLIEETIEELRASRDDDDSVATVFLRRALYAGHPFERSPYGEIPELLTLDERTLRRTYAERLARDDLVIGLAGDVTPEGAAALLKPLLTALPERTRGLAALPELPEPKGLRIVIADKPERTQVQMRVAHPACSGNAPDVLPLWLGTMGFGGTFTSPFTHEVREVRGWSYHASATFDRYRHMRSPVMLSAAPGAEDAVDCLALVLELYGKLARGEVEAEAIERARAYLLNRYPFQVATAADMLLPALRYELLGAPMSEITSFPERLQGIAREDVGPALRAHLDPARCVAVLVATASELRDALVERFAPAGLDLEVVDFRDGVG